MHPYSSNYTSHVGQVSSPVLRPSNFPFRNGKLYFWMGVDQVQGYTEIMQREAITSRPDEHW